MTYGGACVSRRNSALRRPPDPGGLRFAKDRSNNNRFASWVHLAHRNNLKLTKPRCGI